MKTFILGVGAQRSGTTWLYNYLKSSESFDLGRLKEYHVWDALHLDDCKKIYIASPEDRLRYSLQNTPSAYEDYFASLVKNGITSTADISPSYSGLPVHVFREIKERLETKNFDVKVIFLMRDPYQRCLSAVRMHKQSGNIKKYLDLDQSFDSEHFVLRTNYKATVESLQSVFDDSKVFYGIYEELFTESVLKRLSSFCGVEYREELALKKYNDTVHDDNQDTNLKYKIHNFYSDVYDFCFEKFPQTKKLWKQV